QPKPLRTPAPFPIPRPDQAPERRRLTLRKVQGHARERYQEHDQENIIDDNADRDSRENRFRPTGNPQWTPDKAQNKPWKTRLSNTTLQEYSEGFRECLQTRSTILPDSDIIAETHS